MTQAEIDALITCKKKITTKRFVFLVLERSWQGTLAAESEIDGEIVRFKVFFRQSVKLEEKFSIGLKLIRDDTEEDINLARYNGIHQHVNKHSNGEIFDTFHKHFATEAAILKGIKAEHNAKLANYVNFKGAILRFFKELNFENYQPFLKHFEIVEEEKNTDQLSIFDDE